MLRPAAVAAAALAALSLGCATTPAAPAERGRTVGLSLREATKIVEAFEAKQLPPQKRPPPPTSMEEALAVLKSDRLDLFPGSVAWLSTQTSPEALALEAQTLLAWGEAELTVAEVLGGTADALDEGVRGLALQKLTGPAQKKLEEEEDRVRLYHDTDQALRLLAAEHVAAGIEDADKVIAQKPDDYVGYRIAADAYRLRNQWKDFSAMVAKVEERNPDSNGLLFLRGIAAQMRDGDAVKAVGFFRKALERDPQFVRAQAEIVLLQTNVLAQKKELDKLREIAPDHQLVRWVGPGIDEAYAEARARQDQIDASLATSPGPPAP